MCICCTLYTFPSPLIGDSTPSYSSIHTQSYMHSFVSHDVCMHNGNRARFYDVISDQWTEHNVTFHIINYYNFRSISIPIFFAILKIWLNEMHLTGAGCTMQNRWTNDVTPEHLKLVEIYINECTSVAMKYWNNLIKKWLTRCIFQGATMACATDRIHGLFSTIKISMNVHCTV